MGMGREWGTYGKGVRKARRGEGLNFSLSNYETIFARTRFTSQ